MRVVAKPTGQKHHYLPVFYLKQWAGQDGRLCEFSRPHKEVKPRMTHPAGAGYIHGLYTFDDVAPEIRDFLEQQFFLKADDRAHVALQFMLTDQLDFDALTRSAWSRFLMTLLHRNPEGIERTRRQVIEGLPEALELLRKNYDFYASPSRPEHIRRVRRLAYEQRYGNLYPDGLEQDHEQRAYWDGLGPDGLGRYSHQSFTLSCAYFRPPSHFERWA